MSGFCNLVNIMGTDLTVVNAARVSFNKRKGEIDAAKCLGVNIGAELMGQDVRMGALKDDTPAMCGGVLL